MFRSDSKWSKYSMSTAFHGEGCCFISDKQKLQTHFLTRNSYRPQLILDAKICWRWITVWILSIPREMKINAFGLLVNLAVRVP